MKSTSPAEIPLPQSLNYNNSLYSLNNNSSGTLLSRRMSIDTHLNNNINNVEFTNIRSNTDFHDSSDSLNSPSSASFMEKTKESKLGRFLSKTGQKVKKFSDINGDPLNLGLGLNVHSNGYGHGHGHAFGGFGDFGVQGKELKSPVGRTFTKSIEQKLSFGDKLKLLNSTKYKNYHYHNLLRSKKESIKNGMKLGSKNNDFAYGQGYNSIISGTSYALNDLNYNEIEMMIANDILTFDQAEQYCTFLYPRIQHLLVPLFKGEELECPIEDMTKLVSLYVRLRKAQEQNMKLNESSDADNRGPLNINASGINHSHSQNSLNSSVVDDINAFETPFLKPNATFNNSPVTAELNSPTAFSPHRAMQTVSFSAIGKILEEINEILKINMSIMINQLYYDESTDNIKFLRGSDVLLRKRKNTTSSFHNKDEDRFETSSIFNSNLTSTDIAGNPSTRSALDLPILTPTQTLTSSYHDHAEVGGSSGASRANHSTSSGNNNNMNINNNNNTDHNPDLGYDASTGNNLNIGMLPAGRFEKCTSILWDIFQRNILFELVSVLLPVEFEFANGHREASRIHSRANALLYNRGEKITTFTNTLIHPDISGTDHYKVERTTQYHGNQRMGKNGNCEGSIIGTVGEWSDVNIRNILLVGFRDNIVIPLYEINRKFEDVEGYGVESSALNMNTSMGNTLSASTYGLFKREDSERLLSRRTTKGRDDRAREKSKLGEYSEVYGLLQCFRQVSSVGTNDTNQKLVENLLSQTRDRCRTFEQSRSSTFS